MSLLPSNWKKILIFVLLVVVLIEAVLLARHFYNKSSFNINIFGVKLSECIVTLSELNLPQNLIYNGSLYKIISGLPSDRAVKAVYYSDSNEIFLNIMDKESLSRPSGNRTYRDVVSDSETDSRDYGQFLNNPKSYEYGDGESIGGKMSYFYGQSYVYVQTEKKILFGEPVVFGSAKSLSDGSYKWGIYSKVDDKFTVTFGAQKLDSRPNVEILERLYTDWVNEVCSGESSSD